MTTTPTDQELLRLMAQGDFALAMSRHFGLQDESEITAMHSACARLHNGGQFDFLHLVERGAIQSLPRSKFFMAANFFSAVLQGIDAPPSRVMACIESLVASGEDDMAASWPNAGLRSWFAAKPSRATEVIAAARSGDPLAMRNLTFALEALGAVEDARSLLLSDMDAHRRAAVTALGRIPDLSRESRQKSIAAFKALVERADDELKAGLLLAAVFLLFQEGTVADQEALNLLEKLTSEPSEQIIHAAIRCLSTFKRGRPDAVVSILLKPVLRLKAKNVGAVNELGWVLQTLVRAGLADIVLQFVAEFFSGEGELQLKQMRGFLAHLSTENPDDFGRALVAWLLSGETRLCQGLLEALHAGEDGGPVLAVDDALRRLTGDEQWIVCQRAIGWLFMRPRTAASIAVSILRVGDPSVAKKVLGLLFDPLLISFASLRDFFVSLDSTDPARAMVDELIAEIERYLTSLRSVPEVKEIQPSELHRYIQRVRMSEQNREILKQAEQRSILAKLAKRIVILHGRGSVGFVTDSKGNQHAIEVDLHTHSFTMEMPRMEVVDPVGLDYMLRMLRLAKVAE